MERLRVVILVVTPLWLLGAGGRAANPPGQLPMQDIKLPSGFTISPFASYTMPNARALALGGVNRGDTVVYASSSGAGVITALVDRGSTGTAGIVCELLGGLQNPNGIAYSNGSLYVAETQKITRWDGVDAAALAGCDSSKLHSTAIAQLPPQNDHAARNLGIGPDGRLYVTIAAPFNIGECKDPYCTIQRLSINGQGMEIFIRGVRNALGFAWHPGSGQLWFTDMERDNMGDDQPDDPLYEVQQQGTDFGFPYCHWLGDGDPEMRSPGPGQPLPDTDTTPAQLQSGNATDGGASTAAYKQYCAAHAPPPVQSLGPHVAPIGMLFYQASAATDNANKQAWPRQYIGSVFVAEHGSTHRNGYIGYRVANVQLAPDGRAMRHTVFAAGWLPPNGSPWGRPAGLLQLPDGSLLVSDDNAQAVYRITYQGSGA